MAVATVSLTKNGSPIFFLMSLSD
ncbi:hypothetical protein CGLO_11866 [Colletotrichum gloeosporioides Cg-14]|uniref:Uncharacterized protein n=1 Tax=Colletotrichum gloeosporioides (strain Cg-14) TaxID=1237896 RepID=T0KA32_COLGC|nr:hypothetical protein CGLO_11866 [Colletotrichum gloeosporioides Cg-14]